MSSAFLRRLIAGSAALLLLAGAVAQPALAAARVQSTAEALEQDSREYAARQGLAEGEAVRRLQAQEGSVAATDALRARFAKRFAGLFIEHQPNYRIVVLLTGRKRVPAETIMAGKTAIPVVFRTGARATEAKVVAAIERYQAQIRASLGHAPAMGADPKTGELVIIVHHKDVERHGIEVLDETFEDMTGVPVRIRPKDGESTDLGLEGGTRVYGISPESGRRQYCTAGFVVTDGARTGLVTAAHCPDELTYRDPQTGDAPLSFLGQWGWSHQDVQLHVSANEADAAHSPLFYADADKTLARTPTGARPRSSSRVGDVVCRRGETSGYGCSEIELTHFAPPGDLCGGPCAPTWVMVKGECRGGDSGGPVFIGTTALGIIKGGGSHNRSGGCNYWFYMSTDFLPDGWSVLTADNAAPQRLADTSTSLLAK
jgi:hypothetical protein